ncbi:reverse transcriptase [Phytophthora megakarya]|uniref:Reverse transcriptase n=1 Tax=Phytophthora megakarya TaxID=4795 RepID=A0A225VD80_9STRA|nr:reverse transcriptase [Phytophthora megakarya]
MRCSIGYGTGVYQLACLRANSGSVPYHISLMRLVLNEYELPFPSTLKGVQSFLGSLNYYHKFIEDYAVVTASLYELTDDQVRAGRDLSRTRESFEILKRKIVSTPLLKHPDRTKPFVIIPHANQWAACAVLGQMHDGLVQPVRFTGRVLSDVELKYHIAEKEVLAVMRVLHVFKTLIEGCPLIIYTRHSVLKWVINSKTAEGRLVPWGVALSQYDLEIRKVCRDEDGLAAIMGAGITPREHLDEVAEVLIPAKGRVKPPPVVSIEMLSAAYSGLPEWKILDARGYILDGVTVNDAEYFGLLKGLTTAAYSGLPEWKVLDARGYILDGVTVNDAEYFGLLKGLAMALERGIRDILVVGDSRIVIQQVQGRINCNQPNLQRRLAECETLKERFQTVRLVHMKREFNQAADYMTSKTLVQGESWTVQGDLEKRHLEVVSKIRDQLVKPSESTDTRGHSGDPIPSYKTLVKKMAIQKRDIVLALNVPLYLLPPESWLYSQDRELKKLMTIKRIKVHQESDEYLAEIRAFLNDDLDRFSSTRLKKISRVADLFVLDDRGVLYRLSHSSRVYSGKTCCITHEDFQGGHQGITRTHEKLRTEFYWPGMYADVQHFVKECVDCAMGKGAPPNAGPSPGNIEPRCPFEAVSMDFVTHMPESARGNTFLLLFQDMFSGYVMCKPMSSTTAQDVAEAYEEQVFQRFGPSSMIRHDQDPRIMSEVFTRSRELLGSRQRATLGYRPQANGQQERSVQTVIRSVRAYVAEMDQSDWDDHAERLMFALNVSFDATRLDTPFCLVHGWDARSTVSAMLGPKPSSVPERSAYEWRRKLQREYSYAHACADDLQKTAKKMRSDEQGW